MKMGTYRSSRLYQTPSGFCFCCEVQHADRRRGIFWSHKYGISSPSTSKWHTVARLHRCRLHLECRFRRARERKLCQQEHGKWKARIVYCRCWHFPTLDNYIATLQYRNIARITADTHTRYVGSAEKSLARFCVQILSSGSPHNQVHPNSTKSLVAQATIERKLWKSSWMFVNRMLNLNLRYTVQICRKLKTFFN